MVRFLFAGMLILATPCLAQSQPSRSSQPTRISKPPASKQGEPGTSQPKPAPAQANQSNLETVTLTLGAIEMSDEAFRLESAGLTMYLPMGAMAQLSSAGSSVSAKITPKEIEAGGAGAWLIEVRTARSRDTAQTPESVAQRVMEQLQASVGVVDRSQRDRAGNVIEKVVQTRATIIEPIKNVVVRAEQAVFERPAARFYIRIPRDDKSSLVRGYTVFQTGPGEFVTFDLSTPEPSFATTRAIYEATLATARFTDAAAVSMQRGAAINAGVSFLSRLAAPEYDAAIALLNDRWYRLAKPAATGDDKDAEEIAYRRIRAKRGSRGEIDTGSRREKWTEADREAGIVVRFDARYLQDGVVVDVVGSYWMSVDARSEAWSLQQAIRDPKRKTPAIVTETGAREGDQMSVALSGTGQENRRIKPEVPKVGYITQVQSFLLPTLLAQSQAAGEYAFYVYQSQNELLPISMRRDILTAPTDDSNKWILTTIQTDERPPQVSTFNEKGELQHTVFAAQKLIWTPTTLTKLFDLWKAKGLPTE